MRSRFVTLTAIVAVAIVAVWVLPVTVAGQTSTRPAAARPAAAKPAAAVRTPEGYPDLQGLYNAATLTPLERPDPAKLVLSDAEASAADRATSTRIDGVRSSRSQKAVRSESARGPWAA